MFIMDVPAATAQQAPIVLVQADTSGAGITQPDYILKYCKETESGGDSRSAMRAVDPASMLRNFLQNRDKHAIDLAQIKNIKLLESTTHGSLSSSISNYGRTVFHYDSEPEYVGNDRAVFMAEYQGVRYKIVVDLHVFSIVMENMPSSCTPPMLIKVNKPASGNSGYDLNSISVTSADLSGSALGQTTGTSITLDTNAANHNWFIDTTPGSNEEFLPTSNPYEWVAKEGTAAYGKMDMLSVLLHEYGHALGIEHSADSHDYMATTLTAGVRRMPSAEELALMQKLVATLSPTPLPQAGEGQNAPGFPTVPLGTSFIGFLGLLRGSRYGGASIVPDTSTLVTQYAWAANPALTNGSLNSGAGWSTQGGVEIGNGAATLSEVSGSQTRLSQAFLLNPTDRFLSFTLAGTALDDLSGAHPLPNPPPGGEGTNGTAFGSGYGPSDAFEVALLDANSGASLLGSNGLTRTDAFLNTRKEYAGGGPAA